LVEVGGFDSKDILRLLSAMSPYWFNRHE